MRVTLHSALVISTCALALLSQLSSVHAYFGVFEEGDNTITTFAEKHVDRYKENLGLSNIRWSKRNRETLSLARVTWNEQDAFMKCAMVSISGPISSGSGINIREVTTKEVDAFSALVKAKNELKGNYATGRQYVMDPLHRFDFSRENRIRYYCHLYSFIDGVLLNDYIKGKTISQAFIFASEVLHEVIKASIYLYNAGIIHHDLLPKNIMLEKGPSGKIVGVKIIDLDATKVFRKEQTWQPIILNNNEYLSLNPTQRYESCDELKDAISEFLEVFVYADRGEKLFDLNYKIPTKDVSHYLARIKTSMPYMDMQEGNVDSAIPAMFYLLKAHHTIQLDPFTCSSPIRVLRGLRPRTL